MQGRTWRDVGRDKAEEIKTHLLEQGGSEGEVRSAQET